VLRRILNSYRNRHLAAWRRADDHPAFSDVAASFRQRGATIGKRARLLGYLDSVNPHLISIGDYCVIGKQPALLTHCPIKGAAPCRVGNFVYLAFGVSVLPGVTIGDYSVVGAGAVVTKDVPPGSVVAGNPAKVLRPLTEEEKANIRDTMIQDRLFGSKRSAIAP